VVDLTLVLDEPDLRGRFGSATYERAVDYVRRGKVMSCSHQVDEDGDLDIRGNVEGSLGEVYACNVSAGRAEHRVWAYGRCSCPVGDGCKHTVALLLNVRAQQDAARAPGAGRRWERQLASVLDELDAGTSSEPTKQRPLAISVELDRRSARTARHTWRTDPPATRGALRLRPLPIRPSLRELLRKRLPQTPFVSNGETSKFVRFYQLMRRDANDRRESGTLLPATPAAPTTLRVVYASRRFRKRSYERLSLP